MTEKRQKVKKMYSKCHESTKKSLFMVYNLLYKTNLSSAAAGLQKNSKFFNNRPGETLTQTILYLEPHDYHINFVNIDSCHQCGILGAILQMSFLYKVFSGEKLREMAGVFAG